MVDTELYGWVVDVDREATRALYPKDCRGDSAHCGCYACRNFSAQRLHLLPRDLCRLLESIGIDVTCEKEIASYGEVKPGLHLYQVVYDYVGEVLEHPTKLDEHGTVRVTPALSMRVSPSHIELWMEAPWVIDPEEDLSQIEFDLQTGPNGSVEARYAGVPEGLNARLVLLTARGAQLVRVLYEGSASSHQAEIDLSGLSPGAYLVQLRVGEDERSLETYYVTLQIV
jgi:hypothetical protein